MSLNAISQKNTKFWKKIFRGLLNAMHSTNEGLMIDLQFTLSTSFPKWLNSMVNWIIFFIIRCKCAVVLQHSDVMKEITRCKRSISKLNSLNRLALILTEVYRIGVLALSRVWRNGPEIRLCVGHKTAVGLLVDDEEVAADGGDVRQGFRNYSLAGRFPAREQGCWRSWRERRSWYGRSTNHWRLLQSEVWTVSGCCWCFGHDRGTEIWCLKACSSTARALEVVEDRGFGWKETLAMVGCR